jgi:tubulin monoglycylase TTLL3/8
VVKGWDSFRDFDGDYRATQARNILKRFVGGEEGISLEKVAISVYAARLYLENRSAIENVSDEHWKVLKSLTPAITSKLYSQLSLGPIPPPEHLIHEATDVLSQLKAILPQYDLDGCRNIWIVKPGGKSRGRDIFLHSGLEEIKRRINVKQSWIIQKYIENPLLIHNRKFDIRQWVLITSFCPLIVWFYDDCYLRFSAESYDVDAIDNKFSHLTNNSVVKYSENFTDSSEFAGCMWSSAQFRDFIISLTGENLFVTQIHPRIQEIVLSAIKSVQKHVNHRENSFELLGFDLMVDSNMQPWLLEANTSPAMDYSTAVTEELVKLVLEDTVKVVVDRRERQDAETGKFRLIYQETS